MKDELRGLRFPFSASAEVFPEGWSKGIPARVTQLSLRGCGLEMSGTLVERQNIQVRIFNAGEYFEAPATVIYVKPSGVGVMFGDVKQNLRDLLQKWVLAELDKQTESERR
jgi:hypothetical protein